MSPIEIVIIALMSGTAAAASESMAGGRIPLHLRTEPTTIAERGRTPIGRLRRCATENPPPAAPLAIRSLAGKTTA